MPDFRKTVYQVFLSLHGGGMKPLVDHLIVVFGTSLVGTLHARGNMRGKHIKKLILLH